MVAAFAAFICSCFLTMTLIRYRFLHERISNDDDFESPQKFHKVAVPRIGGSAIFTALLLAGIIRTFYEPTSGFLLLKILIATIFL